MIHLLYLRAGDSPALSPIVLCLFSMISDVLRLGSDLALENVAFGGIRRPLPQRDSSESVSQSPSQSKLIFHVACDADCYSDTYFDPERSFCASTVVRPMALLVTGLY
jgi:hypothetical protein